MASEEPGPGQQYAPQARKHTAEPLGARPSIAIEIRWCSAHKGIPGNKKADEWEKIAAEEPNTRGVGWLSYLDRVEACMVPLPRSLANLKREIFDKKWAEARQWADGRTSKTKYRMPKSQKPDGVVAGSTKRLASRFYQLKTGRCPSGQYLHWTKIRTDPPQSAGGVGRYRTQTREHLFKLCPEWKAQQKILCAEVGKGTGRWKSRWKIQYLLADGRCSQAVLDLLSSTNMGRLVLDLLSSTNMGRLVLVEDEGDAGSEASGWELRTAGSGKRSGGGPPLRLPTPSSVVLVGGV